MLANVPDNLLLQNMIITSGQSDCFDATQTITLAGGGTNFIVQSGGNVTLISGLNILMMPGTMLQSGSSVMAKITTIGAYCSQEPPPQEIQDPGFQIPYIIER
jgi:hypothetical protein